MLLGRTGSTMVSLILVLFVLQRYGSPELAGIVTFTSLAPGLVVSPISGALLDRHGRIRLVVLDYFVAAASFTLIAALSLAGMLPVALLLTIVAVTSLTWPLSNVGVRTLFPLIVPRPLWERANAIDSNGYVVSSVLGPALAGTLVGTIGGEGALVVTAAVYAVAAVVNVGVRDPGERLAEPSGLLRDAWAGLVYVVRHATLRGLALVMTVSNLAQGLFFLALPVLLLQRLGQGPEAVGRLFALLGVTGFFSVLLFGRVRTAGRERQLFAIPLLASAAAVLAIALRPELVVVILALGAIGVATGPLDVTLFTVRQRRTDPAWLGRAFAVSMAMNFAGFPVGSAIGGALSGVSPVAALTSSAALGAVAALLALVVVPAED